MKSFLKTTLAVICGIIITSILCTVISMMFFGAMVSAGSSTPAIPRDAVLKIDMSRIILSEQTREMVPAFGSGLSLDMEQPDVIGMWDAVQALHAAVDDPGIKFIYLKADGASGGVATLEEFRKALGQVRAGGKSVVAYLENPSTASMYLATVADKVYLAPYSGGGASLIGISGRMVYYKDLLDKLGINMQLIRHGKYKSAGEPFIRNTPSAENVEQQQVMISSIWKEYGGAIAASRGIGIDRLDAAIDNLEFCLPEDFVKANLADGLLDRDSLKRKIADLAMVDNFSKVRMVTLADYAAVKAAAVSRAHNKIAIIYTSGEIVDGDQKTEVAGDRFAAEIEKVRADSTVKVVVLRVNSPGGSVVASEKIKAELDLLQKAKPVVASYGDYAASGGYWISNGAGKIYTDATTLTGSIGVFGMIPDLSGTYKKVLHLNSYPVNSHKHSDMYSLVRPFDADEYAFMQRSIENIYDKFLDNVSAGRGMTREAVDDIAQGRVWVGSDAIGIGLADEIGTLEDAVGYAAVLGGEADLTKWKIEGYPKPLTVFEQLMETFGQNRNEEGVLMRKVRELSKPQVLARAPYELVLE